MDKAFFIAVITASGYKGSNHLTTILNKVDTSGNIPAFIVLDEFNRLLQKGMSGCSETSLLPELLVLFDDKDVSVNAGTDEKPYWVNPKNLFFILIGSFSNLTDTTSITSQLIVLRPKNRKVSPVSGSLQPYSAIIARIHLK